MQLCSFAARTRHKVRSSSNRTPVANRWKNNKMSSFLCAVHFLLNNYSSSRFRLSSQDHLTCFLWGPLLNLWINPEIKWQQISFIIPVFSNNTSGPLFKSSQCLSSIIQADFRLFRTTLTPVVTKHTSTFQIAFSTLAKYKQMSSFALSFYFIPDSTK